MNNLISFFVIIVQRLKTMKENKCIKYEGLFTFASDEEFQKHLEECNDCKLEHERMQKVSDLIQEVAPQLRAKQRDFARLKLACASFGIVFCLLTLGVINLNQDVHDMILYGQTMTVEDYGFPVDSYGLIMVD